MDKKIVSELTTSILTLRIENEELRRALHTAEKLYRDDFERLNQLASLERANCSVSLGPKNLELKLEKLPVGFCGIDFRVPSDISSLIETIICEDQESGSILGTWHLDRTESELIIESKVFRLRFHRALATNVKNITFKSQLFNPNILGADSIILKRNTSHISESVKVYKWIPLSLTPISSGTLYDRNTDDFEFPRFTFLSNDWYEDSIIETKYRPNLKTNFFGLRETVFNLKPDIVSGPEGGQGVVMHPIHPGVQTLKVDLGLIRPSGIVLRCTALDKRIAGVSIFVSFRENETISDTRWNHIGDLDPSSTCRIKRFDQCEIMRFLEIKVLPLRPPNTDYGTMFVELFGFDSRVLGIKNE